MSYVFSKRSENNLKGVHPKLVAVVRKALQLSSDAGGPDFTVIEGVRTAARQQELYAQGRTKPGKVVTWTLKSNHFINPISGYGHAVDLFPGTWDDLSKFTQLAGFMMDAARILRVPLRWGADWDRDGKFRERGETDSPHFELWGG